MRLTRCLLWQQHQPLFTYVGPWRTRIHSLLRRRNITFRCTPNTAAAAAAAAFILATRDVRECDRLPRMCLPRQLFGRSTRDVSGRTRRKSDGATLPLQNDRWCDRSSWMPPLRPPLCIIFIGWIIPARRLRRHFQRITHPEVCRGLLNQ